MTLWCCQVSNVCLRRGKEMSDFGKQRWHSLPGHCISNRISNDPFLKIWMQIKFDAFFPAVRPWNSLERHKTFPFSRPKTAAPQRNSSPGWTASPSKTRYCNWCNWDPSLWKRIAQSVGTCIVMSRMVHFSRHLKMAAKQSKSQCCIVLHEILITYAINPSNMIKLHKGSLNSPGKLDNSQEVDDAPWWNHLHSTVEWKYLRYFHATNHRPGKQLPCSALLSGQKSCQKWQWFWWYSVRICFNHRWYEHMINI